MSKSKVKIGNVEIEIGGKVIKLKLEEAQELKEILNKTFPEEKTVYIDKHIPSYPYRHWRYDWEVPMFQQGTFCDTTDNTLRLTSTG